jgi:hypothetical protein
MPSKPAQRWRDFFISLTLMTLEPMVATVYAYILAAERHHTQTKPPSAELAEERIDVSSRIKGL